MAVVDTRQYKYKEVKINTEVMSEGGDMSDAAVAAGTNPLSPDWVRNDLRCTNAGLRGQPKVLDLTRVVHHDENGEKGNQALTPAQIDDREPPGSPAYSGYGR